jgi:SAM-dependent methyltransferase
MEARFMGVDRAYSLLKSGDAQRGMATLFGSLKHLRGSLDQDEWATLATGEIRSHPAREWVHQDPFTFRSFSKPRGYPGDAELIDHVYGAGTRLQWPHPATDAGGLYGYTTNTAPCRAVRFRRRFMAGLIDEAARGQRAPRILSIAAGHLREIELSEAARCGRALELIALDQDEASLGVIREDYGRLGVKDVNLSVKALLANPFFEGEFDLVYAAGLFDYLPEPVARKLVDCMFRALAPDGTMMYANFMPDLEASGYMESMMDWWLIYRSEQELVGLATDIPPEKIQSLSCTTDPDRNIAFVTIERA